MQCLLGKPTGPSFTTLLLLTALLMASTWQVAQGLLSARTASCQFPSGGRVFSSEGLMGSVTSLAGISGLSSFPPAQTHLTDFESLQTHSVDTSRGGNLVQKQRWASQRRSWSLGQRVLPGSTARLPCQTPSYTGRCKGTTTHQKIIIVH